jgi:hypothetical protein
MDPGSHVGFQISTKNTNLNDLIGLEIRLDKVVSDVKG